MRLYELTEVKIDNMNGAGNVPNNQEIDYLGLRVNMRPSVFLKLARPLGQPHSQELENYIGAGGAIASPFLVIAIPPEWDDGNFEKVARVISHEGRNRMSSILKLEGDDPIETHLFFNGYRRRHITPEIKKHLNHQLLDQDNRTIINGPVFDEYLGT